MGQKRDKIDIIFDILKSIKDKNNQIKITHILHKANLSHTKLKEYLDELKSKQLIEEYLEKKQKFFKLTNKGEDYYQKLNQMKKFINIFDI